VWVAADSEAPRKICAVGVKLSRGRTMHGFALNVDPDMAMFGHIVPCASRTRRSRSLAQEGIDVSMREVVDRVAARAAERWGSAGSDRRRRRVAPQRR
jgi:lipoate-protein ligase B